MIRVRLKIGDGAINDTDQAHSLVYVSADTFFAAKPKEFEKTSYPEQEGENLLPKAADSPFDYKVKFFINASSSIENANKIIAEFNALLYTQASGSDVKTYKQVEFYNDYKKVKIVGYPEPIAESTDFWRDSRGVQLDVVVVEWTIHVNKPSLCDFNLEEE